MWEDNNALSVTNVFKMTEVSLNALSALHQSIAEAITGWTGNK